MIWPMALKAISAPSHLSHFSSQILSCVECIVVLKLLGSTSFSTLGKRDSRLVFNSFSAELVSVSSFSEAVYGIAEVIEQPLSKWSAHVLLFEEHKSLFPSLQ